ncbi:hypothetical protein SteCoe_14665 [Stentor coeruleus]|uniref:Metallo-beta-lactamase domain-containing protein n=1 Tax=Stentor coeruleus TaxID=5963 RepID=A0A1R2C5E0_9CILI|nr:hypothetical protein SteCoe_14665 [Stentor coeruleus]
MKLSESVKTISGYNPSPFTLNGTNCFIIGTGKTKILIDTGEGVPEFIRDLQQEVPEIECVIITHNHKDHIGGIGKLLEIYGEVPIFKHCLEGEEGSYINVNDGDIFETEGAFLRVIETPGHSDDSISLYFEEENSIFTGDIILGTGSTFLSNYTKYLQSMEKLLGLNPDYLYTAHGEAKVPGSKIREDLTHRENRENQVIEALCQEMDIKEIVKKVYGQIDSKLAVVAEGNTKLYLENLMSKGKVAVNDEKWMKIV